MTRDDRIQYVAASIIGSCLSEAEAREINGSVGWHPDDIEGEDVFYLTKDDLRAALLQVREVLARKENEK